MHVSLAKMNASSWRKAADLVAQGTQANQQVQAAATADFSQLESFPLSALSAMPHAIYFNGNLDTVTKINHVPYQTIVYNDNSMFTAKLMNDTPIKIFIDNGATPSILPLCSYNRFPIYICIPEQKVILPYIQEEV